MCDFKDNTLLNWMPLGSEAFHTCKGNLSEAILLNQPLPNSCLANMCELSDSAVGTVSKQKIGELLWHPLLFFSKKFSSTQQKYSTYNQKLIANLVFRDMIAGTDFMIYIEIRKWTMLSMTIPIPRIYIAV